MELSSQREESVSHLFTVSGANASAARATSLTQQGLSEPHHLERWVVQHPEVLGDDVRIVTTQFSRWASPAGDQAAERLDVLGLDNNGQLVVVELKRDGDKRVHLQALTYAALVATFSQEQLGRVHAQHLRAGGQQVSDAEGLSLLVDHVDGDWDPDLLRQPRIVLIAERFPMQILTTAKWLSETSGQSIQIECLEVALFELAGEDPLICASFTRVWPIDDMSDRFLKASLDEVKETQRKLEVTKRRARTAKILVENNLIPDGAVLELQLSTWVHPDTVRTVQAWLDEDPQRSKFTWRNDASRPLAWEYDSGQSWSLSRLAKRVIAAATQGDEPQSMAGGDVWTYRGQVLAALATQQLEQEESEGSWAHDG